MFVQIFVPCVIIKKIDNKKNERNFFCIWLLKLGLIVRKLVFRVPDQVMLKQTCSAAKGGQGPGRDAQSVTCLATDVSLTADPGVASSIPARSHTFVEIEHEIISTVILLPSAESFKKGCCQLQAKVCARSTGLLLAQACPGKSVVR